jgi:medium-chain acyl-[acyl-carrier-protein] hydrolase
MLARFRQRPDFMPLSTVTSSWLSSSKPKPEAALRLFCFPYAGGGASIFRRWPDALPSTVEVRPVQLPGRDSRWREAPFTNLRLLVEVMASELSACWKEPFAFFGHSMGAVISFALARHLRAVVGVEPVHLFMSGRRAPQVRRDVRVTYNLPHDEFIEELRKLNGTPDEVLEQTDLMELMLPVLRSDFELVQTYIYTDEPPFECPITAFGGLQDVEASREDLDAWRAHTRGEFTLRLLPGDHFFLNKTPELLHGMLSQQLSRSIRERLRPQS